MDGEAHNSVGRGISVGTIEHKDGLLCECEPKHTFAGYADIQGTEPLWIIEHVDTEQPVDMALWSQLNPLAGTGPFSGQDSDGPWVEIALTTDFILPVKDMAEVEALFPKICAKVDADIRARYEGLNGPERP